MNLEVEIFDDYMVNIRKGDNMINLPLMSNNISEDDVKVLIEFLQNTDRFTNGPKVREFEQKWSEWLGVKHSVFVNSGSSANFMTMAAIAELYGVGEIIVPAITWSSDISSVIVAGHKPVFVDVDLNTLAMKEEEVIAKLNDKTKAVFLSHILGFDGLSDNLIKELKQRNILLIEDVCESHGTTHNGVKAGCIGFASNFSFYYAHHMSTIEGGMICTNDDEFYQFLRMYRSHGMLRESTDDNLINKTIKEYPDLNPEFIFTVPGYNMRSTELNAVVGINQLKRLDDIIKSRTENFKLFLANIDNNKFYTDFKVDGSSNYAFVIMLKEANKENYQKLIDILKRENVEFRRGTAGGGNQLRQPFVKKRFPEEKAENYKNADMIHFYGVYVGNFPDLDKNKILALCDAINEI